VFACSQCPERYTLDDIKHGRYFPSTGVCLACYIKMNKSSCFGKKKYYNPSLPSCGIECKDSTICKTAIYYPEFLKGESHGS